ncbi:MAG: Fic family protein [Vulcanimicrobiaceae bacterium]
MLNHRGARPSRLFESLAAAIVAERERVGSGPLPKDAERRLRIDCVLASARVAGSSLERAEVAALLERGLALGGRPLGEYLLVADYGEALALVESLAPPSRRRPWLSLEEIVHLHAAAVRRASGGEPGRFRTTVAAALPSDAVPPAPWLVARDLGHFVERLAGGPPARDEPLRWVAEAHLRFERIRPFACGNGRVGRLVVTLLLRRLGFPSVPFPLARVPYLAALRRADAGDRRPLAILLARATLRALSSLGDEAGAASGALRPLASFACGAERAALYKAAQRGRLRTVRRGRRLFVRADWIAAYRDS